MKKLRHIFDYDWPHLNRWIRTHPVKVIVFALLGLACGALWEGVGWRLGLVASVAVYFASQFVIWRDLRRMTALAMALSLLIGWTPLQAAQPHQDAAPAVCVVVVAVIVGLGIVGCRIGKRGAKVANGRTNGWPEEIVGQPIYECGAAFTYVEECYAERSLSNSPPVAFTLNILVKPDSNLTVTVRADTGEHVVESLDEFKEWLAGHALSVPDQPAASSSFEINRQPAAPEQVPIKFDWGTRTATINGGSVLVTVESSDDLREWTPLTRLNVRAGQRLSFSDASSERMFYRVSTATP